MVVVLCSLEISFIVCKKRSCRAIGCAEIIAAGCTSFRRLKLAFGVDDFRAALPLRLSLTGHRALYAVGQNNVSDLHRSHFDSPRVGLPIDDLL
jgi:hypothetical protein